MEDRIDVVCAELVWWCTVSSALEGTNADAGGADKVVVFQVSLSWSRVAGWGEVRFPVFSGVIVFKMPPFGVTVMLSSGVNVFKVPFSGVTVFNILSCL